MPPTKDHNSKHAFGRSSSNNDMSFRARIYHPATNLLPPSPPLSPTGVAPSFSSSSIKSATHTSWSRQNSQNGGNHS